MEEKIAICILAYNRYDHLNRTLHQLFAHDLSGFDVLVFQDGPKNKSDEQRTLPVSELITSLPSSKIKHKVIREQNMGLANAVIHSLDFCFETYDKVIVLEDDILIHDGFLEFLSGALLHYSTDTRVAGISGFSYYPESLGEPYFLPIGCSWGWATWKRNWHGMKNNPEMYLEKLRNSGRERDFNFGSYPFKAILESAVRGESNSWAIQFYAHFFLKNQWFLFPSESFCENIGFDNSGTHTGEEMRKFNSTPSKKSQRTTFTEPGLNPRILGKLKRRMSTLAGNNWKNRLRSKLYRFVK